MTALQQQQQQPAKRRQRKQQLRSRKQCRVLLHGHDNEIRESEEEEWLKVQHETDDEEIDVGVMITTVVTFSIQLRQAMLV